MVLREEPEKGSVVDLRPGDRALNTAIIVPFQTGDNWRHRAWDYVHHHYQIEHDWPIITGTAPGPVWSKGAAVADALTRTTVPRLVIADADSLVAPERLRAAVEHLEAHPWVVPQTKVRRLSEPATVCVYDGEPLDKDLTLARSQYPATAGGGIVVLTRDAYDTVRGIDPRFEVWGGEDEAFGWALESLVGAPKRLSGVLWHLWHPRTVTKMPPAARQLRHRYCNARRSPIFMRALIDERETTNVVASPRDH